MNVSIIIPSYNAGPQVLRLLRSLAQSELDADDHLEVVLVDDGSTDGTGDLIAGLTVPFDLTYLFLPRVAASGRAAARNAGIGRAAGDVVVMVDADQIAEPGFVAAHLRYHRLCPDLVVVGPRRDLADDGYNDDERLEVVGWDDRERLIAEFSENFNQLETCWHHMFSCNVSVRRTHLLAVGGFDDRFLGWGLEDSELGYRLRRRGLAFAFDPAAVVYQRARDVSPEMFVEWRRNLDYFIAKYAGVAEVAVQSVVCRAFDPTDRCLDWLESMRRFEFAARALAGRLPEPTGYELVEVDDAAAAVTLARLPELAATSDLLVLDHTAGAELAGPVQCITTRRELAYFHCRSAADRERILARFRVGPGPT